MLAAEAARSAASLPQPLQGRIVAPYHTSDIKLCFRSGREEEKGRDGVLWVWNMRGQVQMGGRVLLLRRRARSASPHGCGDTEVWRLQEPFR